MGTMARYRRLRRMRLAEFSKALKMGEVKGLEQLTSMSATLNALPWRKRVWMGVKLWFGRMG